MEVLLGHAHVDPVVVVGGAVLLGGGVEGHDAGVAEVGVTRHVVGGLPERRDQGQRRHHPPPLQGLHLRGRHLVEHHPGQVHPHPAAGGGGAEQPDVLDAPHRHQGEGDQGHRHHLLPLVAQGDQHHHGDHQQPLHLVGAVEQHQAGGRAEGAHPEPGPAGPEVLDQEPGAHHVGGRRRVGVGEPVLVEDVGRGRHHPDQGDHQGHRHRHGELPQQPVGGQHDGQPQDQGAGHLERGAEPDREVEDQAGVEVEEGRLAVQVPDALE